ncbi:extracellular solute-binding protein [Aquamicrobium sp. LC103]|uniref:ABC transporter substrate-binding protein n=1 Tax=Aquamicrobium sp. LC103 TaxID=1120658 RepID=UPI000B099DE7|nr:extracellular solute-binding protein [Aquamicrobium sp. LC103]
MIGKNLLAIACAGALWLLTAVAAQAEDWDAVVEAAKAEGVVKLYSAQVGVPELKKITDSFEAKYGIPVQTLEMRASELVERLRLEGATGRTQADVAFSGGSVTLEKMGVLQPHGEIPNMAGLDEMFPASEFRVPIFSQSFAIVVNEGLVPEADRPKSWADLADPKWKGKILSDDFRALGGGGLFFAVTYDKLGKEFHEKLARNEIVFSREIRENARRVARGEYPIYLPYVLPDALLNKGLPLAVVLPEEGTPYGNFDAGVVKDAAHPNAARLFIDFFLSEEAQLAYAGSGRRPTVKGLEASYPEDARPYLEVGLLGTQEDPEVRERMLKLAGEMYH